MWDKQKEVFLPSTPGLGMHVEVKDPEGKVGTSSLELLGWTELIRLELALGEVRVKVWAFTDYSVAGGALPAVRLRGPLHLHFPHSW